MGHGGDGGKRDCDFLQLAMGEAISLFQRRDERGTPATKITGHSKLMGVPLLRDNQGAHYFWTVNSNREIYEERKQELGIVGSWAWDRCISFHLARCRSNCSSK